MSEKIREPYVLAVGGANVERMLIVDPGSFAHGRKHSVPPADITPGGSAINHACRLLSWGTSVRLIAPICRDSGGRILAYALQSSASKGGSGLREKGTLYLESEDGSTPHTTLLSIGVERTFLTEHPPALFDLFEDHLDAILSEEFDTHPSAIMIGHVHADRAEGPGKSGALTERVLEQATEWEVPVFANPGSSQYRLGPEWWAPRLSHVNCFQLQIEEMREFCRDIWEGASPPLPVILDWFAPHCTVIVTLERMGAVGRLRGSNQTVIAWPYGMVPGEIVDTTGAGDAFGAGVVASMLKKPLRDDDALESSLRLGSLFASYCCTTLGGARDCPSREELELFGEEHAPVQRMQTLEGDEAEGMLRLIDQIFPTRS